MGHDRHLAPQARNSNPNAEADSVVDTFVLQRQALNRLLASGEFHRSPNLEKILTYLCKQYFLGRGNFVKEYSVATEALDRREDFDPKRDSIVRVEMHRLRRRLKEYYAARGAEDAIRITIPDKSYVPEFVAIQVGLVAPQAPSSLPAQVPDSVWIQVRRQSGATPPVLIASGLAVLLIGCLYWWVNRKAEIGPDRLAAATEVAVPVSHAASVVGRAPSWPGGTNEFRILAGHSKGRYPDRFGVVWQGDDFFVGGKAMPIDAEVRTRGLDSNLFANMREGDFTYEIPLSAGAYELTLFFAETSFGEGNVLGSGESTRQFHLHINGRNVLSNFDVLADAQESNTATVKIFRDVHPDKNGKLNVRFESSQTGKAFVNAMIVRPGIEGKLRPIRMVCRPHVYRDSQGEIWEAEHFYRGGMQITRPTGAPTPKDTDLYRGERFGKFSYSIPVPPGKYQARLFFAEYWWGANRPGLGGVGSRVFDVFCNFRPLLSNFDILKRNPKDGVIVETFHGLEPNLDSKLVFDFEPRTNYAMLNAIEITDEPKVSPIQ